MRPEPGPPAPTTDGSHEGWGVSLITREDARVHAVLTSMIADRFGAQLVEHYQAPPVIARSTVELAGYPTSFPHLMGTVHALGAGGASGATDLVLTAAACHHLYPLIAGSELAGPVTMGVDASCFRAEATGETGRLRSFRMHEIVFLGAEAEVSDWRDRMLSGAAEFLRDLGLSVEVVPANDPFFGRPGRLRASVQLAHRLKWEMTAEVADGRVQAVASANCHESHFGEAFTISDRSGRPAHSACLAFGLDRLTLALKRRHGSGLARWLTDSRATT